MQPISTVASLQDNLELKKYLAQASVVLGSAWLAGSSKNGVFFLVTFEAQMHLYRELSESTQLEQIPRRRN